jgi:SAM-dependent methyltransferase
VNSIKSLSYPAWTTVERQLTRIKKSVFIRDRNVAMGLRGTEYDFLIHKLGSPRIKGARVLLQGIGLGEETALWEPYGPRLLVGIDYEVGPPVGSFNLQGDLARLPLRNAAFEIAASLNVFEHVRDIHAVLTQTRRVLVPGGWFLASFGPLFSAYGGDHFSSLRGGLEHGYNHLLLEPDEYRRFVTAMTIEGEDVVEGRPQAGLAYIREDLFSHASVDDYRSSLEKYMTFKHFRAHVDPSGLAFRERFPDKWKLLLDKGFTEKDLLVSTVTVIGQMARKTTN